MIGAREIALFDALGQRKYLCATELARYMAATKQFDPETRTFCQLLAYTGCRISEALALTRTQLDFEAQRVVFRTLKRRRLAFRAVPVPVHLMHSLNELCVETDMDRPIWAWSRQTAWRRIKQVMQVARIAGAQAMPKGLRHGFGIANAQENVPMAITQRWLGHAKLDTTAIYQQAVGREELGFAERLWQSWR